MKVRDYTPEDEGLLRELWRTQGLEKEFPDLNSPEYLVTKVVEQDGKIVAAASGRQTIEAFIFVNRQPGAASPHRRWEAVKALEEELARECNARGFFEGHVFLAPQFPKFLKRLMMIGWRLHEWHCLSKEWPTRKAG
jgi:surfactin synthase thioesterase subunit